MWSPAYRAARFTELLARMRLARSENRKVTSKPVLFTNETDDQEGLLPASAFAFVMVDISKYANGRRVGAKPGA